MGAGGGDSGGRVRGRSRAAWTRQVNKAVETGHEAILPGLEGMRGMSTAKLHVHM